MIPEERLPDPADHQRQEPVTFTEWGVIVDATGEMATVLPESLARAMAEGRDDVTLVSREVTWQPWRVTR